MQVAACPEAASSAPAEARKCEIVSWFEMSRSLVWLTHWHADQEGIGGAQQLRGLGGMKGIAWYLGERMKPRDAQ